MSAQALRHLRMFLAAAIIIWACQTCSCFSYILQFAGTVFYIIFSLLLFFFSSVLLRAQKWGMDLLGVSRFFRQRAHTRNFCGTHLRVTFLATHKLFLFSSQYHDDSSAISCCPYRTSCTTPTEACGPGDARIPQSKEVKISCPGHSS